MDGATLVELFNWSEEDFSRMTEGSALRRIGYLRWLRNLAVGLGNAARAGKPRPDIVAALDARARHESELVREHVEWALAQHAKLA